MKKGFILPSPILKPYIDRYWYWESEDNETISLPPIFPGTGTEFFLHYKEPFKGYPKTHILCPRNKDCYKLVQNGSMGFISVRFKSPSFKYFTNIPVDTVKNQILSSYDIWGIYGSILEEEFLIHNDFNRRIEILNAFFEDILSKGISLNHGVNKAIDYIYYNYSDININSVISETNLSLRTFQRRFKEIAGTSAKEFHKISRFQTVLKSMLLNNRYPSLNSILDSGYYDQSHFNKDFKSFTGANPTTIFKAGKLAHFYNTSLN